MINQDSWKELLEKAKDDLLPSKNSTKW